MIEFFVLLFLLILSLGFFISYPFVLRKVLPEKFHEFCDKKMPIICYDKKGNRQTYTVQDMCPFPFDEEDLK